MEEKLAKTEDNDYLSYKPRSCIFFWDNDVYSHTLEQKRWVAALRANASNNHSEEMMQALINVNTESNEENLWRPWWKSDTTNRTEVLATGREYMTILGKLIRREINLLQKIAQKEKIHLEKKIKKVRLLGEPRRAC